ncbi:MAG: DNA repair protein [Deltaproteobacteria bacterium]|nr:MAG: DNA repair protein [Deltaproteobacteria bacterium]
MILNRILLLAVIMSAGCSSTYYGMMEKAGIHKRDILVDRIEGARNSQQEAREQFKSALDQFDSVIKLQETDLKAAYERLNEEYEASEEAAEEVSRRIDRVEKVSEDLFDEWEHEVDLYENKSFQQSSRKKLAETRRQYQAMLTKMERAEKSMYPVLHTLHDNVLYLKHNLNAQAIGSLHGEFANLTGQVDKLVDEMNKAIASSNEFISSMK